MSSPLLNSLEEAQRLAAEKNTTPEAVYRDDALYEELVRRTFSPTELANGVLDLQVSTPEKTEHLAYDFYTATANTVAKETGQRVNHSEVYKSAHTAAEKALRAMQDSATATADATLLRIWGKGLNDIVLDDGK